ncbi:LamG domain-containing protein [Clostridium botulinum]|uniref:LamG domain-containing protein n=1 Tax=Clostridium botulinum TaxID=1491 RepID=UPI000947791B|nr:LamG domain-containing protein [Clostridium botulinum]APQ95754.1 concanavalin A-like lectin/glucanases superfamily protein [Clostridium botulinum]MBN3363698.1 hypothetical protein [Clostridium botulinum]
MAGLDKYTKLLLHMDDLTFKDEIGHIVTNNGIILESSTKKFGKRSAYFNGSGNLTIPSNSDLEFTNENFTIDCWINMNSLPSSGLYYMIYDKRVNSSTYGDVTFLVNSTGGLGVSITSNNTSWNIINNLSIPVNLTVNQWYHVALIRDGSNFSIAVNGTITSIGTSTLSIATNSYDSHIGGLPDKHKFNGYIDEFRISKGIARWTSDFTPPTKPYDLGKYLINQNKNYYSTKSNFLNLGQPIDNIQLENWYNKYGADDVNIITQNLNNKEFPMSKSENGIWKTDSELDINEVIDSIELVDIDENNKYIKYNCNDYRILDLCDDQFKLTMCKTK